MTDETYTYITYRFKQDPYELYEVLDENKRSPYHDGCDLDFELNGKVLPVAYVDKYNDMDQIIKDWNFEQVGKTVLYPACEIAKMKGAG